MRVKSKNSGLNENISIQPATKELERLYLTFAPLFNNIARSGDGAPRIVIQTNAGRRRSLGWFAAKRWMPPGAEIGDPLLHEMTHYSNYLAGVADVGKDGRYHNQRFKEKAESIGLVVEKDARLGWSLTTASVKLRENIEQLPINAHAFKVFRLQPAEREKQPTKMKKWACECTIVRCVTELTATCQQCGYTFANVDRGEQPQLAPVSQQAVELPVKAIAETVHSALMVTRGMKSVRGVDDWYLLRKEERSFIVEQLESTFLLLGVDRGPAASAKSAVAMKKAIPV